MEQNQTPKNRRNAMAQKSQQIIEEKEINSKLVFEQ